MFKPYLDDNDALGLHDGVAEQAVLAAVAADPTARVYWEVANVITEQTFHDPVHQECWRQIGAAVDGGMPMPSVPDEVQRADKPVDAAKRLLDLQQKRLLITFGDRFWRDLHGTSSASTLITEAEQALNWVRQQCTAQQSRRLVSAGDLFETGINQAEEAWKARQANPDGVIGIPTSFWNLDRLLGGFQPGVHVLAAVPGLGKSTLTRQITANAVKEGYAAFVVSFEEDIEKLAFRFLCSSSEPFLKAKGLLEGYEDPSQLREIAGQVRSKLKHLYLTQGTAETSIAEVKGKLRVILANQDIKNVILVVDYLQIWAGKVARGNDLRVANGQLLGGIREIAIEMKIPALVISSQNRQGYETAGFASLKEAGEIEYSADSIIFMLEQADLVPEHGARVIKLSVHKNRFGDRGDVLVEFEPEYGSFFQHAGQD